MRLSLKWLRIEIVVTFRHRVSERSVRRAIASEAASIGCELESINRLTDQHRALQPAEPYECHNRGIS